MRAKGMRAKEWYDAQRAHYERRTPRHLQPSEGGLYARNIVRRVWDSLDLDETAAGIEVGCGAGRFTVHLLEHCRSLTAIDLSRRQLDALRGELARREIASDRCALHEANVEQLAEDEVPGNRDFAVGVFILHHLHDPESVAERLFRLLRPGGRIAFLEPNRWNPLYLVQIAACTDMSWREEKGLYRLGRGRLRRILENAGFTGVRVEPAGFFPPQILNRWAPAPELERRLERLSVLRPLLPFHVLSGERPAPEARRSSA